MSEYIVSARKYRPDTFASVVGQESLTTTLKNAILQNKLAHAYLFCGPRGVGKTSCARIFAKTINCTNRTPHGEHCDKCESCVSFNEQRSLNVIELDAASNNSVDDMRDLIEQVRIGPVIGKYRVYIIDEVHMLSQAAFNAFLKTLEEPPPHAIFILATTDKQKVLPTIISRCQVYDFNRISIDDIVQHLSYVAQTEHISVEPRALQKIAAHADGGMRDALSIFDQLAGYGQGHITYQQVLDNLNLLDEDEYFRLLGYIYQGRHTEVLLLIDALIGKGFSPIAIMQGFSGFVRNVLMAYNAKTLHLIETSEESRSRYQKAAATLDQKEIWAFLKLASEYEAKYRQCTSKRLTLEVTLLSMCALNNGSTLGSTLEASIQTPRNAPMETAIPPAQPSSPPPPTPDREKETFTVTLSPQKTPPKSKQRMKTLRSLSISLAPEQGDDQSDNDPEETKRNTPFTQEDLNQAWYTFCANEEGDMLLKQTLTDLHPTLMEKHTVALNISSQVEKNKIKGVEDKLLNFLCDTLSNDHITLTVTRVSTHPSEKLPTTFDEKLSYFRKKSEWVDKLAESLSITLPPHLPIQNRIHSD